MTQHDMPQHASITGKGQPYFDKVLIANRGEIACRVIATCRRLGIATVAVYSDADRDARHVRLADEAIHIGASPAQQSYLRGDAILAAARASDAQAIHPGYGFLSENAGFADACAQAGVVFIGPPAQAIRAMGDKSAAKALMQRAGVPLTPGYHGDEQAPAFLRAQADAIGYPVLIKASAGGGGKGMRRVDASAAFEDALASCQREAQSAFGNAHVLVEKYVERPRHIEIQVFADTHGAVVHLFERDCSVQRRHQKVLDEAPAPGMTEQRRAAMGKAAVDAARAVGYVGAGTVEFIAGPDGDFYFMEMNTRLQVEHPVTELITGTDLVDWQLRVAAGLPLPKRQDELRIHGHALEARLYAEDADRGFLPSTGTLRQLRLPAASAHVRIDAGVEQGDTISPYYDPMIAKLIVWDHDRPAALARMRDALAHCHAIGVTTNSAFLARLVSTQAFATADLDTGLIEREQAALFPRRSRRPWHGGAWPRCWWPKPHRTPPPTQPTRSRRGSSTTAGVSAHMPRVRWCWRPQAGAAYWRCGPPPMAGRWTVPIKPTRCAITRTASTCVWTWMAANGARRYCAMALPSLCSVARSARISNITMPWSKPSNRRRPKVA